MIQITAKRNQHIDELEVKGHAGSDEYGRDLVCAILSGIVTGLANALYEMAHEEDIILDEGYAHIKLHHPSSATDIIMNTAIIQLKTAQEVNKDYIRIMEV